MKKYDIQQFNMLQDVITQFSRNPKQTRSGNSDRCLYNPPKDKPLSAGCAIGMYLTVEVAQKLDQITYNSIIRIMKSEKKCLLPFWMQKMDLRFLSDIQSLHDQNYNFDLNGFSNVGLISIKDICKDYNFPFKELKIT